MPSADISIDDRAFLEGFRAAMDVYRDLGELFAEETADKVVEIARELAPKRTGRLAESIHHEEPVRKGTLGVSVDIVAGEGVREAIPMEFGTYKDRAQPFMRPALALAAGALRSIGISARLSYSDRARLFRRRAVARAKVRRAQRRGALRLSPAEARATGRFISSRFRYRGERRRRRG